MAKHSLVIVESPAKAKTIGKYLGGRDHTTIIHGHDKILADMGKNESLRNTIEILKKKINPQ